MKKNIDISGIDPLAFVGPSDKNIKEITKKFNSKIVVRGSKVSIDGKKEEVSILSSIMKNMISTINQKGFVDSDDVNSLMNLSINSNSDSLIIENDDPIVLYTHKGVVSARTNGQIKYLNAVLNNDIVFAIGPAGTGKTYQAVASAASALKRKEVDRIVITRPAVEAGERLGFLPGDLREKVDPYLTPLYDALKDMFQAEKLKLFLENKTIEVAPLAYMRGRTLHNSFIILDEAQNTTRMQMKMFLTRLGATSKSIITGDITQIDLGANEVSGLIDAIKVLKKVSGIEFIMFNDEDVVRHRLVKDIIKAYGDKDGK